MKTAFNILCIVLGCGILAWVIQTSNQDAPKPPAADSQQNPGEALVVQPSDADIAGREPAEVENPDPVFPPNKGDWKAEFEFTERSGETVSSDDLAGQPYVASFFFTRCPSSCPTQNQKLADLQKRFAGKGVKFLAFSVDPNYDTPEVLREYANRFGADPDQWYFLTGDLTKIRQVGTNMFQQPIMEAFHTDRFGLVDADGNIEGIYSWNSPTQYRKLIRRIDEMLNQTGE